MNSIDNRIKIGDKIVCWQTSCVLGESGTTKLEPLPMAFLKYLLKYPDQVISREQLLAAVWHNRHVSDDAIRRVVKKLRDALGDDAKSPIYIKTLPLQGYKLIASVGEVDRLVKPQSRFQLQKPVVILLAALSIFICYISFFIFKTSSVNASSVFAPDIEPLTHLSGSEIIGDFCEQNKTLLFTYRINSDAPYSLYSKNLENKQVKRLSFNDNNYYFADFSNDCSQIAYSVKNKEGYFNYIAKITNDGITEAKLLTSHGNKEKRQFNLVSWSSDNQSLYFNKTNNTQENGHSFVISKYNLITASWKQITFAQSDGLGDYFAKESQDGRYLAVFRNTAQRRFNLVVLDLENKEIAVERHLPFFPSNLVWLKDKTARIAISSFKGDFYYYDVINNKLVNQPGSKPGINDVFYHCGNKCFYMRQHEMNYTDIKELPNPFIKSNIAGVHIESDSAEFNPVYNKTGKTIYYTSKDDKVASLKRKQSGGEFETLFTFNPRHIMHELRVHPNESYITGKIENRIFLFDLTEKTMKFITSQHEQAYSPLWDKNGEHIYFSRLEQNKFVLQKYHLVTESINKVEIGLFARYEDNNRVFVLDGENNLYQALEGERKFITKLSMRYSHSWQIFDDFLYFTQENGVDVDLHRLDLTTGERRVEKLFKNSWRFDFMLHPAGEKMLITESLLARSDLVKVTWQ